MTQISGTGTENIADNLKGAMRGFAQSVVIITTLGDDGVRYAMAATAVTPVSMDPPSMLICVNRTASAHRILEGGAHFCLNILSATQADVGKSCAVSRGDGRFAVGDWRTDEDGLPYLADAQAVIVCHQRQVTAYGSHDIIVGDVQSVRLSGEIDPLIYLDGAYRRVGPAL